MANTTKPSTAEQRGFIVTLFKRNELQTGRFTLMHRIPFRAAKLPEPPGDGPIEPHLQALSCEEASRLIVALKAQAGIEDDEGEGDDEQAAEKKTAFCLYCRLPRFPSEIRIVVSPSGQNRRRCAHCIQHSRSPQGRKQS